VADEYKLQDEASKGVRAKLLLENELLIDAFKALEDSYAKAWRSTTIDDVSGREKLFLAINIVGKVREHLTAVVASGALAKKELDQLATLSERKKRFGIV
jgi:hypothetical protein